MIVRGKRHRRTPGGPSGHPEAATMSRGGRMKPASQLASSKRKAQNAPEQRKKRRQRAMASSKTEKLVTLSALESLPVELIEQIFLHSLETNMTKASPHLSTMLSKTSVYNALILFAFFDDNGRHPVETHFFLPAQYRLVSDAEKLRLQQAILNTRWCTLERIEVCIPSLTRLRVSQAWHEEDELENAFKNEKFESVDSKYLLIRERSRLPKLNEAADLDEHFFVQHWFKDRPRIDMAYFPGFSTWTISKQDDGKVLKHLDRRQTVLGVRYIPDSLLVGQPWTEEKLRFFRLLLKSYESIRSDSFSGPLRVSPTALFEGMKSAIREDHSNALLSLLNLHYIVFRMDTFTVHPPQAGDLPLQHRPSHPIPVEIFHLCAEKPVGNSSLMDKLVDGAALAYLPKDDVCMTRWAMQDIESKSGGEVGRLVRRYMDGTLPSLVVNFDLTPL